MEWRVSGVSRLLSACRIGEAVESPLFSAAGLDRLQLHLYPRGCERGGQEAQPCALFVSGPPRTMLRGTLFVGSHPRHFEHRFVRRGDMGGRNKFCSLEHQVDCDDSVVIALELGEAETDLPETTWNLCLRNAAGTVGNADAPSKGKLSMRRGDPKGTEEFQRCVSLPTLQAQKVNLPFVSNGSRGGSRNSSQRMW